ncbi:MAG: hypothetical protein KAH05_04930 [Clostridiales bacterium]|nr:hypothetical protein [Clostridiales bacterium]
MYNVRYGINFRDDVLPLRILNLPRNDNGTDDNLPPLEKMLSEYYEYRGWDDEGIPKETTLKNLNLFW